MSAVTRLLKILFLGLMLFTVSGQALADGWPAYPNGWWQSLKGGEKATFEMVLGTTVTQVVITIYKVDGSKITFNTQDWVGGRPMRARQETVDAAKVVVGALPPRAKVKKGEAATVKVGEESLECTLYDIEINFMKTRECRSSRLPPVFNKGVIRMETRSAGQLATLTLKSYTGTYLGGSKQ